MAVMSACQGLKMDWGKATVWMDNFKLNLFQMKNTVNDVIESDIMLVCWYASKHINSNNSILPV